MCFIGVLHDMLYSNFCIDITFPTRGNVIFTDFPKYLEIIKFPGQNSTPRSKAFMRKDFMNVCAHSAWSGARSARNGRTLE